MTKSRKQHKIFLRVFVVFGTLVLLNTLLFAFLVIPMQEGSLKKVMFTQAETVSRSIVQASADAMMSDDFGFIVEHNVQVLKNNDAIQYILVESKRGMRIWADVKGWKTLDETPPAFDELKESEKILPQIEDKLFGEVYHFVYPIKFSSIHWGWLHIGFSTEQYLNSIKVMYYQIGSITLALIMITLVAGYLFARWITRPISSISELASRVADGDLSVMTRVRRNDEIGQLADSFNDMVAALKTSKLKLEHYNEELAQEVAERTKELDRLNVSLDQRVKEEVANRRQQEQLLIHQSRLAAMGEMIGAIAHQWRQPLNALGLVLQNIQLTQQYGQLDEAFISRAVQKAERLINNMSSTIDDFRDFFKPDKHAEDFYISVMLQNVVELMEASLSNKRIKLQLRCDDTIAVTGYQSELAQVLLNLINNAKDSCIERKVKTPEIDVIVGEQEDFIELSVCDNGGGIPDSIRDKIYDPYFTTKEEGTGTGIGLYMSKMIIEKNMAGKLTNHNSAVGSCFVIKIPKVIKTQTRPAFIARTETEDS